MVIYNVRIRDLPSNRRVGKTHIEVEENSKLIKIKGKEYRVDEIEAIFSLIVSFFGEEFTVTKITEE